MTDLTSLVLATKLFRGLTAEDLDPIAHKFELVRFGPDEQVVREGKVSDALFVVIDGEFKVVLPEEENPDRMTDVELTTLQSGSCFGEFSLFHSEPASASVIATRPSDVVRIRKADFFALVNSDRVGKKVFHNLIHLLVDKIRRTDRECDLLLGS